jgi:hypothetical protein
VVEIARDLGLGVRARGAGLSPFWQGVNVLGVTDERMFLGETGGMRSDRKVESRVRDPRSANGARET